MSILKNIKMTYNYGRIENELQIRYYEKKKDVNISFFV